MKRKTEALESGGRHPAAPADPAPTDRTSGNKKSIETAEDYPEVREESISSSSSLHERESACRHMERRKSDAIVTLLNRQVRRAGNEITNKRKEHLTSTQKKDMHTVFCREFKILYPQESIPTFS